MPTLPYLTRDLPGIGGRIKDRLEDFHVQEIPLYELSGRGTHVYFRVHKWGIPTPVAVNRIARYLGVHPNDVGVAGLKDAQAVTSQMMSVEFADVGKLEKFRDAQMRLEFVNLHGNKLRPGLLAGNVFTLRIRQVGPAQLEDARKVLDCLARRGVPNYFGQQRFGSRGDTGKLGQTLVKGDLREFVNLFLGRALPGDPPDCKAARDAFDSGYYVRALQRWPRHYTDQRRALIAYKRRQNPVAAIAAIDKRMKRLYVSAFQSMIFNEVLARRIDTIDRIFAGDLAQKTDTQGIFLVESEAAEQPRAERFEISPTGPIVGYRSNLAEAMPGQIEREALAAHGVGQEDFRRVGTLQVKGSRRPLRFRLQSLSSNAGQDRFGQYIELSFAAPSGCYATVVLREIMKTASVESADAEQPPQADQ